MIDLNSHLLRSAIFGLLIFFASTTTKLAHERPVHAAMSFKAANSSERMQFFIEEVLQGDWSTRFSYESQNRTAAGWISEGSRREDDGNKFLNHFYRTLPPPPSGFEDPNALGWLLTGFKFPVNSFKWASSNPDNSSSWIKAREYQFDGITGPSSKATRDSNLGHMFKALGHIVHLNQDLSSPGHTRNDAHPFKAYIEKFGEKVYYRNYVSGLGFPNSEITWAQWRAAGFEKLEDFWNRSFYVGLPQALNDNENPSQPTRRLGLGEFSSGNFLSEQSLYKELHSAWSAHYAPLPSLTGTDYFIKRQSQTPPWGAAYELFPDRRSYKRWFLSKITDGIPVDHHSVLTYLGARFEASTPPSGTILQWGISTKF
jgi:hypothetical protein